MKRRDFTKIISCTPALLYFNSCGSSRKFTADKRSKLLYSFLYCNDIHVTTDAHAQYFAESIDNWTTFPQLYDFLVICGDLANWGLINELEKVKNLCAQLERPWYPVIGNHDVAGPGEEGKKGYRHVFGTDRENYVIEHKGTVLIFLDLTEGMQAHVTVRQHTLDWLQSALSAIPEKRPIIVFSHFPLHPRIPQFKVQNTEPLLEILDVRKVLACFSGHYHAKWKGTINNVSFIGNTCMSLKRDNHDNSPQEGYLLVNVHTTHVETHFFDRGTSPVTY